MADGSLAETAAAALGRIRAATDEKAAALLADPDTSGSAGAMIRLQLDALWEALDEIGRQLDERG